MPFIKLAATEIVSGVSGESEQKVRELFSRAVVRKVYYCQSTRATLLAFVKPTQHFHVVLGTDRCQH